MEPISVPETEGDPANDHFGTRILVTDARHEGASHFRWDPIHHNCDRLDGRLPLGSL